MKNEQLNEFSHKLNQLLKEELSTIISRDSIGLLFSGGLDSSILASVLASVTSEQFPLLVTGIETAKDIKFAQKSAYHLNLPLTIRVFTVEEVKERLSEILSLLKVVDVLQVELAIPLYFAAQCASQFGLTTLFSGQGADELFGGYARYEEGLINTGEMRTSIEMLKDLQKLQEVTSKNHKSIVRRFGLELVFPFLKEAIITFSYDLPFEYKLCISSERVIRKQLLRTLAKNMGLPDSIVNAPKRAMQYGTGSHKMLATLAVEFWRKQKPDISLRKARQLGCIQKYLTYLLSK